MEDEGGPHTGRLAKTSTSYPHPASSAGGDFHKNDRTIQDRYLGISVDLVEIEARLILGNIACTAGRQVPDLSSSFTTGCLLGRRGFDGGSATTSPAEQARLQNPGWSASSYFAPPYLN